jgi:hypothetical protein
VINGRHGASRTGKPIKDQGGLGIREGRGNQVFL